MDPLTIGAGFMGGGGSSISPGGGKSDATGGNLDSVFNNSGWTVATGQGNASGSSSVPWAMILIAAVVGLAVWKLA